MGRECGRRSICGCCLPARGMRFRGLGYEDISLDPMVEPMIGGEALGLHGEDESYLIREKHVGVAETDGNS